MKVEHCVQRPVKGEASPWIDRDNIEEIANWCHGTILVPLFADLTGPEIEFFSQPTDAHVYARLGDRIMQLPNGFLKVTPTEFEAKFVVIESADASPG